MFTSSEQFITQMKFRELREQRDKTLAAYDELARAAAEAPSDAARLRALYAGLREVRFAKQSLHPNVANLDLIIRELDQRWLPEESIAFWRAEMDRELARGRLRAEIVYTFGALLEEWTGRAAAPQANPPQAAARREWLEFAERPSVGQIDTAFIDELVGALHLAEPKAVAELGAEIDDILALQLTYLPTGALHIEPLLKHIRMDPYRSAAVRSQAQRFLLNPTLQKELHDALGIMVDHLDEWRWPEPGVPAQAYEVGGKWRLFLDEDLPTALLLEYLGDRWRYLFDLIWRREDDHRLQRLKRLLELGAPNIIIENERRMLASQRVVRAPSGSDIWSDEPRIDLEVDAGASAADLTKLLGENNSIIDQRGAMQAQLRRWDRFESYSDVGANGGMETAVNLIHAEIALGRAAFPNRPLYVMKIDLSEYYPALSHELIVRLLTRLGLPEQQIAFFRRYLDVRIDDTRRQFAVRRGIPIRRRLADTLGELVLRLLDAHVERTARVRVVRFMDDIGIIAASGEELVKAWEAVDTFCRACGLFYNQAKCGAVCIGGELPPGLLEDMYGRLPTWMLLNLDRDGQWHVDSVRFNQHLEQTYNKFISATSIIEKVHAYNAGTAYLEQALALTIPLGETHRQSVSEAVARWHYVFMGNGPGIVERLRSGIRERFTGASATPSLPEAWLYWPVTAGGLGLRQIVMRAASYAERFAQRGAPVIPSDRPDDWERRNNEWARLYRDLLQAVTPIEPATNPVMETLVNDFISRGAVLSSGKQQTLSPYWRWILYVYGPQVLDAFGTFRFLLEELVPVQLLTEHRVEGTDAPDALSEAPDQ